MLKHIIAFLRINKRLVCELSKGRGLYDDFHDYPDSIDGLPEHFTILRCKRCGKEFMI